MPIQWQLLATTMITLDKTPLLLSSFRRTPSIFYPIIHDGYRDYSHLTFKLNRAARVVLAVKNSKGKTIRTIKKSCVAGTSKMSWDGKYASDESAHVGTFTYQLTATDSLGNIVKSAKLTTTIRNYQLVRTSSSSVKVIPR